MRSENKLNTFTRSPFLIMTGDIFFYIIALILTILIRYKYNTLDFLFIHIPSFSILLILWTSVFYINDLYEITFTKNWILIIKRIVQASVIAFLLSIILFYFGGEFFSLTPKTNLVIFSSIFCFLAIILRLFIVTRRYVSPRLLILIGESNEIAELSIFFETQYKKVVYLSTFNSNKIFELFKNEDIASIILDEKEKKSFRAFDITLHILSKDIQIILTSTAYEAVFKKIPLNEIESVWFLEYVHIKKVLFDITKRLIDVVGSIILIIILSPLMIFSAIGVMISSRGPIFYHQVRVGKNGKNFNFYKFRSMYHSEEKNPDALGTSPVWSPKDDPRRTPFGKFLRNSHFDEFPQLFIIFFGAMSFVGPRPERPFFIEELSKKIPYFEIRHMIKPGLTGWAQIRHGYTSNIDEFFEKFQYDLYYLKNRSLILDILIILKTLKTILP